MPPTLEEIVYDLARAALDEQRDVVANLRVRAAPVLAAAAALAALLAKPAVGSAISFAHDPGHAALVVIGIAGAVGAIVGAILVLATREFGFSVDAEHLYTAAYADRGEPEMLPRPPRRIASRATRREPGWRALVTALSRGGASRTRRRGRWLRAGPRPTLILMAGIPKTPSQPPPPAAPQSPRPPKVEPYPNIFIVEGKALGATGETRTK